MIVDLLQIRREPIVVQNAILVEIVAHRGDERSRRAHRLLVTIVVLQRQIVLVIIPEMRRRMPIDESIVRYSLL